MSLPVPSDNTDSLAADSLAADSAAVIPQTSATAIANGSAEPLAELITAAVLGDQRAWGQLHERYTPLVSSVCRRFRLTPSDAEDVSQTLWLRLVQNLGRLREPGALPGWIATTAKHEALRVLKLRRRTEPADPMMIDSRLDPRTAAGGGADFDENLHRFDQRQALNDGLRKLSSEHRLLLSLLQAEPKIPYEEIGRRLGIPVGSIGPTRARCLRKLRHSSGVRALVA